MSVRLESSKYDITLNKFMYPSGHIEYELFKIIYRTECGSPNRRFSVENFFTIV